MTVKYCLKKGFVQVLLLWFLSWHPTPCLSCARPIAVELSARWRVMGMHFSRLDGSGLEGKAEAQGRAELALAPAFGHKKWKDPLCFRAAYLLGRTIGLSVPGLIGVAPELPRQGLYAHFRTNRSVRFPVFRVERKGAGRQGFSVCVVTLFILGSVSAGWPLLSWHPWVEKTFKGILEMRNKPLKNITAALEVGTRITGLHVLTESLWLSFLQNFLRS